MNGLRKLQLSQSLKLALIITLLATSSCKNNEKRDPNAYYATIEKVNNHEVIVCDVGKMHRKNKSPSQ